MTKAQAAALSGALEARQMPHSLTVSFPPAGGEDWRLELDPARTYLTPDLLALANYCTQNGLALSIIVSQLGVS